jgi:hypothetical protein
MTGDVCEQGAGEGYFDLGRGGTGGWRRLYLEELRELYSSSPIVRAIKWRRMSGGM